MKHLEKVQELRAKTDIHWNCCQSVLGAFAEECGLSHEQVHRLAMQFGSGMKIGSTCGAITGGLMALGMMGASDDACRAFIQHFRDAHGALNCPDLLRIDAEKGNNNKKAHCDGLVFEAVEQVAHLMQQK